MDISLPPKRLPEAFSDRDFNYNRLLQFVHIEGDGVLLYALRQLYEHSKFSENGQLSLDEYCKRAKFNIEDKKLLVDYKDQNPMTSEFTITISSYIITNLCAEEFKNLDKECKKALKDLKDVRNILSHDYLNTLGKDNGQLTVSLNNAFQDDLAKVEKCCIAIYEGIGVLYNIDVNVNIEKMKGTLNSIKASLICQCDSITYQEDIRKPRNKEVTIMRNEGSIELKTQYKSFKICHLTFLFKDKSFNDVHLNDILIKNANINMHVNASHFVTLICGKLNSKNTDFCKYILNQWCEYAAPNIQLLQEFELVIQIENLDIFAGETLSEYLTLKVIPNTSKLLDGEKDDLITTLKKMKVLFVIDGYSKSDILREIYSKFDMQHIIMVALPEHKQDFLLELCRLNIECCCLSFYEDQH